MRLLASGVRRASYVLLAVMATAVVMLHLGPAVLAGLLSYTILDTVGKALSAGLSRPRSRWLSLAFFVVAASGIAWMFGYFLRHSLSTIPEIAAEAVPKINALAGDYGLSLPFADARELRQVAMEAMRDNADALTRLGGLFTKGFFQVLAGIFVAILCFMREGPGPYGDDLYDQLSSEVGQRIRGFMRGFEKILGAQIIISSINATVTACYLLAMGFPNIGFLTVATFFLGILPIVGNVLSNTIVVGTALTLSFHHAVASLVFLIVVHKAEYFLNSRIVGVSIDTPMWQTLICIFLGEAVLGIPGIVIAPAMLHYLREEMRGVPVVSGAGGFG